MLSMGLLLIEPSEAPHAWGTSEPQPLWSLTSHDHQPRMPRALQALVGLATRPLTGS